MPVPTTTVSLLDIQNEFGGTNPIGLNEYYNISGSPTFNVTGIPSTGQIDLNSFKGKSKPITSIQRTVNLTTGTFNAPGAPGAWVGYNSPPVYLPSNYISTVKWNLKFYAYKNTTSYGWAYPSMSINGVAGVGIAGASYIAQNIYREWLNQTTSLGSQPNTQLICSVGFYTYPNLTSCYFVIELTYNASS